MRNPTQPAHLHSPRGHAHSLRNRAKRRSRRTGLAALSAIVLAALLPALAQASVRQTSLDIRIQILPSAEVATLPASVQRLESLMPGYGDHWAHARDLAATDPLHAVRTLRAVHQRARDHHGGDAWLDDMVSAGQGLFADQDMSLADGHAQDDA